MVGIGHTGSVALGYSLKSKKMLFALTEMGFLDASWFNQNFSKFCK